MYFPWELNVSWRGLTWQSLNNHLVYICRPTYLDHHGCPFIRAAAVVVPRHAVRAVAGGARGVELLYEAAADAALRLGCRPYSRLLSFPLFHLFDNFTSNITVFFGLI